MKEIKLLITIKDELKNIRYWKKLDEETLEGLKTIDIEIDDHLVKEYELESNVLSLSYYVAKSFIGYNNNHSLYKITHDDLKKLLKNEFKFLNLDNESDLYYVTIRKLLEHGLDVIPVNDNIFTTHQNFG